MSNTRERMRAEDVTCFNCKNMMKKANVPGRPWDTDGFVCPVCGLVAFFVGTQMGHYYGVTMAKNVEK
jgi:hypothetical protein